jgi:hypothetical protein
MIIWNFKYKGGSGGVVVIVVRHGAGVVVGVLLEARFDFFCRTRFLNHFVFSFGQKLVTSIPTGKKRAWRIPLGLPYFFDFFCWEKPFEHGLMSGH